jgi:16S rRNA (guanine527-N7)-methyltransferase
MLSEADKLLLKSGAKELGVTLDSVAMDRLDLVIHRLYEANQHVNLTRVPSDKAVMLHLLDSLTLGSAVTIQERARMLDMGTGAGFPGIPLAIAYPSVRMTLVDSTRKRLNYIETLITELKIDNVRLVHGRAEDLLNSDLCRSFDIVTARAVADMSRLAGWLIPFVAPLGFAVAYKSESARAEIKQAGSVIQLMGGRLERIAEVRLPGAEITRLLAVVSVSNSRPDAAMQLPKHYVKHAELNKEIH